MPFCTACCGSGCARGNQILPLQWREMTDERGGILDSSPPVGEHKCMLLVRKLCFLWEGSQQWVSLAKWAIHPNMEWFQSVLSVTQIIGSGIKILRQCIVLWRYLSKFSYEIYLCQVKSEIFIKNFFEEAVTLPNLVLKGCF